MVSHGSDPTFDETCSAGGVSLEDGGDDRGEEGSFSLSDLLELDLFLTMVVGSIPPNMDTAPANFLRFTGSAS